MGLVRISYPNFNGSHFGLPPSSIHRMTGLGGGGGGHNGANFDVFAKAPLQNTAILQIFGALKFRWRAIAEHSV